MPQTRRGVFPVLLPSVVIVPLAAALAILGAAAWSARESRQSAVQVARDELRLAARAIEVAAKARAQAYPAGEAGQDSPAAGLAAEAGLSATGGAVIAVTDGVGTILHLSGAAPAGARTVSDIFPRIERRIFISAREAPAAGMRMFDDTVAGQPVVIAAARLPVEDWRLFVAVPAAAGPPVLLLAGLAVIAAAALAGLLAWTGAAAARVRRAHAEEMEHERWKLREARAGLEECAHLAREAGEAVGAAADASRRAAADTDGASTALGEARPLVADTGALLGDSTARLGRLASAAGECSRLAGAAEGAAAAASEAAGRAEEALARAIPAAGSAARAASRIRSRIASVGTLAEKARLVSLNASVEAGRGDDGARRLLRAVEEVQGLAGRAAEAARGLAAECATVAADAEAAQAGAEEAGRQSHEARQGAGEAARAAADLGTGAATLGTEAAGTGSSPAGATGAAAGPSLSDRACSALAGIEKICSRVAGSLRETGAAAARAAAKCGEIERAGQAGADGA